MNNLQSDRRIIKRLPVKWDAECMLGEASALGMLRDVSAKGAFFEPGNDMPLDPSDVQTPMEDLFAVGNEVLVTYTRGPFTQAAQAIGVLRWTGNSRRHDCPGFGIEFNTEILEDVQPYDLNLQKPKVLVAERDCQDRVLCGSLEHMQIASLLLFLEAEKWSGLLHMTCEDHNGIVSVQRGRVVNAKLLHVPNVSAYASMVELYGWKTGRFEFRTQEVEEADLLGVSTTVLLIELAQLRGEARTWA